MAVGHKGDFAYENTGDSLVEFFSKAGSLSKNTESFHGQTESALDLFQMAWLEDEYKAMQLSLWLRDCRGGQGRRQSFRDIITWIAKNYPEWIKANIHLIPQVGRWDDLIPLFETSCEAYAISLWVDAIIQGNGLAAKWAPRQNKQHHEAFLSMRKASGLNVKEYRKLLSSNTKVIESQMSENAWGDIAYNHVPSVAMHKLVNTFVRHDNLRFGAWSKSLSDPNSVNKINASVLYPHDCIKTMRAELSNKLHCGFYTWSSSRGDANDVYENSDIANAQFAALPNYMEKSNARIMAICDFSGSMDVPIDANDMGSGKSPIHRIDVAMGLGLYCSDRIGKGNPFYRMFMPFSTEARLVNWKDDTFSVAVQKYNDGYCGSTCIESALEKILDSAKMMNATNDQIPNLLLIISDMQWDRGNATAEETTVEAALRRFEAQGFTAPKVVYWDLAGYATSPACFLQKNVGMVSGFSPSTLDAILGGEDFTPLAIMNRKIAKYNVIDPRVNEIL